MFHLSFARWCVCGERFGVQESPLTLLQGGEIRNDQDYWPFFNPVTNETEMFLCPESKYSRHVCCVQHSLLSRFLSALQKQALGV